VPLATDMDYPWFEHETKIGRAAGSTGAGWLVQCQRARGDEVSATCKGNRGYFDSARGSVGACGTVRRDVETQGEQHRLGRTEWRLCDDGHLNRMAMKLFTVEGEPARQASSADAISTKPKPRTLCR
jgi:hypothetical protein